MSIHTWRIVFAVFMILHGLMTMSLATVAAPQPGALRTPFFPGWWRSDVDTQWPINRMGVSESVAKVTGWVLWLASLILFVAAGIGLLGIPGFRSIWQTLAAVGAGLSIILVGLFWHPWLIMGIILNAGILLCISAGWFTRWFGR